MAQEQQTRGKCTFCGREMTRGGMARHLRTCPERKAAIEEAAASSRKAEKLHMLQARDAWRGDYWLYLEMKGTATLSDLDQYLRAIWLECCGHLSQFSIGGWSGDEIPMGRIIDQVFRPDVEITHIYDFGSSSHTLLQSMDTRQGKPLTRPPIYLMARNNPPKIPCIECGEPASWLCLECMYERQTSGAVCDEHVEQHQKHDNYGPTLEIVNSPRVGMCGYKGPAEPPY